MRPQADVHGQAIQGPPLPSLRVEGFTLPQKESMQSTPPPLTSGQGDTRNEASRSPIPALWLLNAMTSVNLISSFCKMRSGVPTPQGADED